ncbi:MAG: hypothetical protein HYW70_03320 [Candidatus Nealsonbacteria bacterium]|nr:hypothetical protein [Candidatus Nealsonbacteria bacterium]
MEIKISRGIEGSSDFVVISTLQRFLKNAIKKAEMEREMERDERQEQLKILILWEKCLNNICEETHIADHEQRSTKKSFEFLFGKTYNIQKMIPA